VARLRVPAFIADVFENPTARNGLLAGSAALVAAAMDPKVWGPSQPNVQAAIRVRPELEGIVLVAALGGAALLLVGGAIGDSTRARSIIVGGLAIELIAALVSLLVPSGALFLASRFVGHAAAAFLIPASLALVATSYTGIARATAIGLAYGAYGAAGAASPILLQLVPDNRAPAFLAAIAACALASWFVRGRIAELSRPSVPERSYVVGTAIWAFGVIALTVGLFWIGGSWEDPLRWAIILGGILVLALGVAHERRRRRGTTGAIRIERRPVAIAVTVGVVLGIAQTAPMMELPRYFQLVLGYQPLFAMVALAPLFGALVLAGPVAGFLLGRYSPRTLVGVGATVVGLGCLLLALISTPSAGYPSFVVPCLLVGAGFVVATTVRTAIIFASVPRGMPATAAALNESSIAVGTRIGVVLVTAIVAEVALASYTVSVAGLPATEAQQSIGAFRDVLAAVGTPSFSQVASAVSAADAQPYIEAYASGVRAALALGGLTAVIGGLIAWVALGRHDPLATVYELRDERAAAAEPATAPPPAD
jgi:MFS transporter, DHA2 family, multidrug resistance protein